MNIKTIARTEALAAIIQKSIKQLPWLVIMAFGFGMMLLLTGAIEFAVLYRIFDSINGPDIPGDSNIDVIFMGLGAAVMIGGYHIAHKTFGDNGLMGALNRSAKFLIPLYFLGAVGLFIAINTVDVATFLQSLPPLGDENLGGWGEEVLDAAAAGELPKPLIWIIENILPYAGILFGIFSGGLAIVSLFVANHLIDRLTTTIKTISSIMQRNAAFKQPYRHWQKALKELIRVTSEKRELASVTDTELTHAATQAVLTDIQDGIRVLEYWNASKTGFRPAKWTELFSDDLGGEPPENIDPEFLKAFITDLKAITPQNITQIITPKPTEKPNV